MSRQRAPWRLPLLAWALLAVGGAGQASAATCGPFGLTLPQNPALLAQLEQKVGCRFAAVRWFQDWREPFNLEYARQLVRRGSVPELSWQPRVRDRQGKLRGVPYRSIARGEHDAYLRQFARSVRRLGHPVTVTFAPEMNGDWGVYQLGPQNTPEDFKRAWKHLHGIFRAEGAPVRWVWAPNILYPTMRSTYRELYPGDAYVDEVGLDGYNWGTTHPWNLWKSFDATFGPSYRAITALTSRPLQLGELASVERGGDKAAWIADMCRALPRYPRIKRVFWFHILDGQIDWRLSTSARSLKAFRDCVDRR